MIKRLILFLLCLLSLSVVAEQRTTGQLCRIAQELLPPSVTSRHIVRGNQGGIVVQTPQILRQTEALSFVGYKDGGYVVLSNESTNETMLGYSEEVLSDTIPDNVQWWINAMNEVLKGKTGIRKMPITAEHKVVEPLIKTLWSQREPYNSQISVLVNGSVSHPATGCGATAMAQIIKYHKYPQIGVGSHRYWNYYANSPTSFGYDNIYYNIKDTVWFESEFSAHEYDYDNMLDIYSRDDLKNKVACDAVALLMKDCGISVNMYYTPYSSGSAIFKAYEAFYKYFDYDESSIKEISRDKYKDEEWKYSIVAEIEANRPVLYSGRDTNDETGHIFILDGIDDAGLVHVNWGWGQGYNGYYDIDLLKPYIAKQNAVIGIKPKAKATKTYKLTLKSNDETLGRVLGGGEYREGTKVELTAIPATQCRLMHWSDNGIGTMREFIITSDTTVIAEFAYRGWYVNLVSNSEYRGTVYGAGFYNSGDMVRIRATANEYWQFVGWTPNKSIPPSGEEEMEFKVTNDTNIYAVFEPKPKYKLNLKFSEPSGEIRLDKSPYCSITKDTILQTWCVYLEAYPPPLYKFAGWSDGVKERERKVVLTSDSTLSAQYAKRDSCSLSLSVVGHGKIIGAESGKYLESKTLQIEAVPDSGYSFTGWSDSKRNAKRYITITCDTSITAYFEVEKFNVKLISNSNKRGTVSGEGSFYYGTKTTIKALANQYWNFVGWTPTNPEQTSNVISPYGEAEMEITVSSDTTLYAIFEPIPKFKMNLKFTNPGLIRVDNSNYYFITKDTVMQVWCIYLEPWNTDEYKFVRWKDSPYISPATTDRLVRLTSDTTIIVQYEKPDSCYFKLSVVGHGKITGAESGKYLAPKSFQLNAVPDSGSVFVGWSEDGYKNAKRSFRLICDTTITAYFERINPEYYKLTLSVDSSQMGIVTGDGTYKEDTVVTITAEANFGYHFVQWSDGDTINPRNVLMDSDKVLKAVFVPNLYTVTLSCNSAHGTVTGAGEYDYNTIIEIEAGALEGYRFDTWSDNNKDNPRSLTVDADKFLEAIFVDKYSALNYTNKNNDTPRIIIDNEHVYIVMPNGDDVYSICGKKIE